MLVGAIAGPLHGQQPATPDTAPRTDLCSALPAGAALRLSSPLDDLARMFELRTPGAASSRAARRGSEARWPTRCTAGPAASGDEPTGPAPTSTWEVAPLSASARTLYRSGYPDDRNDGALWAGRGLNAALRAGAEASVDLYSTLTIRARLAPELVYQRNTEFEWPRFARAGFSPYIYAHFSPHIDLPHRFGPDPFSSVEWGQSFVRAESYGVAAGLSTENLWWGPAVRYPLLMSNTAPGFPHLFVGTAGARDIRIGRLDAEVVWGRLTESDYFDSVPGNDRHMLVGISVAFSPRPFPGLWLGFARLYHYEDEGWTDVEQLLAGVGLSGTEEDGNALASVFGRWVFSESQAEVYAEWAREDAFWDFADLVQEPDHSQAYMIGGQKVTALGNGFGLRAQVEIAALQELGELRVGSRPLTVYYAHDDITQGHTHRGQLLGAGIGPGADAQFAALDLVADWGAFGLWGERVRRADFALAALELRRHSPHEHDAELTGGIRGSFLRGPDLAVSASLAYSFRYNRDFRDDDTNWTFGLEATFVPDRRWRLP